MTDLDQELTAWRQEVSARVPAIAALLSRTDEEKQRLGYQHTLEEILQQPVTWTETAERLVRQQSALRSLLNGTHAGDAVRAIMLTGSGSSLHAAECLAPALQAEPGIPVRAIPGGDLLTPVRIALPGGTIVTSDAPGLSEILSR